MKKIVTYIAMLSIALAYTITSATAQTNAVSITDPPKVSGRAVDSWEFTLGGGGVELNGDSYAGIDFSIGTNPFECRPEIWFTLSQSLYWEPGFAGSSDVSINWSQDVWNDTIYLNVGWSGGILYGGSDAIWRTGPEASLQYYFTDEAFVFGGVNYDLYQSDNNEGSLRYSFGFGLLF